MTEQQQPNDNTAETTQQANEHADTVELSGEQAIIAKLEAELNETKSQLAEQQDMMLRIKAEAENVRRRASMDVEKAHKFALEKFAGDLLPVAQPDFRGAGGVAAATSGVMVPRMWPEPCVGASLPVRPRVSTSGVAVWQ